MSLRATFGQTAAVAVVDGALEIPGRNVARAEERMQLVITLSAGRQRVELGIHREAGRRLLALLSEHFNHEEKNAQPKL